MHEKTSTVIMWTARILSLAIISFGLPFYFGYGNPLPFIDPTYGTWDNIWLSAFPIMFIGLGLGWKYEKIGGWMIIASVGIASIVGFAIARELVWFMSIPLGVGVLYVAAERLKK